jgi:hypothetical protein
MSGTYKRPPERQAPIVDSRRLIVAILESGDPAARAFIDRLARKLLPGTGAIDVEGMKRS